ncbi:toxin-antitoxin system, toxin component [Streptomyces sp. SYSU K217416]
MRKLADGLALSLENSLEVPADPPEVFQALCDQMSELRQRPIELRIMPFPREAGTSGLWLAFEDRDMIVVEENTKPEHQLVILGHELWHMQAGHCHNHGGGAAMAARALADGTDWERVVQTVAARTEFQEDDENQAENFGLLLGSKLRSLMSGPRARGPVRRNAVEGRIEMSLGYRG